MGKLPHDLAFIIKNGIGMALSAAINLKGKFASRFRRTRSDLVKNGALSCY